MSGIGSLYWFKDLIGLIQPDINDDSNLLLTIVLACSVVILIFLCAVIYVTQKKQAMNLLIDEFTGKQEQWVENRVSERLRETQEKVVFDFFELSNQLPHLGAEQIVSNSTNLYVLIQKLKIKIEPILSEKLIHFISDIPEKSEIQIDESKLDKMLSDLIRYCLYNCPAMGCLTIIGVAQENGTIDLTIKTEASENTDDEIGRFLDKKEHSKIHDSRNTSHQLSTPCLVLCQMVIATASGEINTRTSPNQGASFHFNLAAAIDGSPPQFDPLMQQAQATHII